MERFNPADTQICKCLCQGAQGRIYCKGKGKCQYSEDWYLPEICREAGCADVWTYTVTLERGGT